ncbi:unnamed protein product [Ixodes pacificus]
MAKHKDDDDFCFHCKGQIDDDDGVLECSECRFRYHIGTCAGVTEKSLRGKKPGFKEIWKCKTCLSARARTRSTLEDGQSKDESPDVQQQLTRIMGMLTILAPLKQQVDELVGMKQTVMDIEKSVQAMSDNYDEVLRKMKEHDSEIKELRKKVNQLEQERKTDETNQLKKELNKLEQYGRRNNLEVHGLVETINENLLEKLNKIADQIEVPPLTKDSVEAIHRVLARTKKTSTVIVRFVNRNERNAWLQNKQKLRSEADDGNVYLQENMTASNRQLFYDVRTKAKHLSYKFIWHKEGCSYVRKQEGAPTNRIEHEGDLEKIK